MDVYPLKLMPVSEHAVWGRRNWPIAISQSDPADAPVSAAWACIQSADLASPIANDAASLAKLASYWGDSLLGRSAARQRVPCAVRWLATSAASDIFINAPEAPNAAPADLAWFIVDADSDACLYRGLVAGATVESFLAACRTDADAARRMMVRIPARPGHCIAIPEGVPHAAGPGVVIAEIGSSMTERTTLADDEALTRWMPASMSLDAMAVANMEARTHVTSLFTTVTRLFTSPAFHVERVRFMGELEQDIPYAELVCWLVLEGRGAVLYEKGKSLAFERGDCMLLPAGLRDAKLRTDTDCDWLEITTPTESDLAAYTRPAAVYLQAREGTEGHPIPLNITAGPRK